MGVCKRNVTGSKVRIEYVKIEQVLKFKYLDSVSPEGGKFDIGKTVEGALRRCIIRTKLSIKKQRNSVRNN